MSTLTLTLPWPPRELSPNARVSWPAVYRAKQSYMELAWGAALEARPQGFKVLTEALAHVTFVVPTRRRYDLDNLMAMLKPAWDAFVATKLIWDDDSQHLRHGEPKLVVERGCEARVEILLEALG